MIRVFLAVIISTHWLSACDSSTSSDPLDLQTQIDLSVQIEDQSMTEEMRAEDAEMKIKDQGQPDPIIAEAGENQYALIGETVRLDARGSMGAVAYQWDFGNGEGQSEPSPDPAAVVSYSESGRYRATLTAFAEDGASHRDQVVITVTAPATHVPVQSDTLIRLIPEALNQPYQNRDRYAVVVSDDDAVVIFGETQAGYTALGRLSTASNPRTIVSWTMQPERPTTSTLIAVVCQDAEVVQIFKAYHGELLSEIPLPSGSRPFGVIPKLDRRGLYVTLQGTGHLAEITGDLDNPWRVDRTIEVAPDLRGITQLPDGRILMSRWRSPNERGELWVWNPEADSSAQLWALAYDPQDASDTEIGGVPSYLNQLSVNPQGTELAVPSTQVNFAHGSLTSGRPSEFDEVLRAVVSFVDLDGSSELFERRKQFDGRGFASAATYTSRGDYLYVAMRGSRTVERLDRLSGNQSGSLVNTGYAVEGLILSRDDQHLFVNATLDRLVKVYDVSSFSTLPTVIAEVPLVIDEPLSLEILLGKQLFNDSADPRLSREGYIACAHCHLDGDSDLRTWDFSDRGEGLRQTISLLGRGGMGHGPLHWSGNFDEGQDFENDIRGPFGGLGLMSEEDFHAGTRSETLGDEKSGLSAELDALAMYMSSLNQHLVSPFRDSEGRLSPLAQQGKELFFTVELGCSECHIPPRMTDSAFIDLGVPLLHDVGTITPLSGTRLGEPLEGLDTPTLHGLWHSAPYLHDGSAATLRDVLTTFNPQDLHGVTSTLSSEERLSLEVYLLSLDGRWE